MPTLSILAAELLKVRKRWIPYILLLPVVAALAFQTFLAYFIGWRNGGDVEALYVAVLPWSLPALLDMTQFLGAIMIGILAASMTGTEEGWGTVRQALVRGQSRSAYLTTKLLGIAVVAVIGVLVVMGIGLLFSIIITVVEGSPITLDVPGGDDLSVVDVALMGLRTVYTMTPYVLLAFCLTVVGRSTTLGVAGVLVYVMLEAIVLAILGGIGGEAADARTYFIGHNVMAILVENQVSHLGYFSMAARGSLVLRADLPDPGVAALVLALYCAVFLTIAYVVFNRRDLGASAG